MNIDLNVVFYTLGIYAAIVVSPGPNFALVSRLALQGRTYATQGAIFGLAFAATFYAILAMLGLSALLAEVGWLVRAVQIAGGLYLIYLGLVSWRSNEKGNIKPVTGTHSTNTLSDVAEGLKIGAIVNLANPKGIAFFVGLYAVAVPLEVNMATRVSVLLGGILLELSWYNFVALVLSRRAPRKVYDNARLSIDRIIGSILIVVGGKMVLNK